MILNPRSVAAQGIGFRAKHVALQGFWHATTESQPASRGPEVVFTTADFFADFPRFRRRKRRNDEAIVAIFGH